MRPFPPPPPRHPIRLRPRRAPFRLGFTLIELLVVLSIMSVVLTCVGVMLHTLARVHFELRSDLPDAQALTRLSLLLRGDAHDARDWKLERPEPDRQVLSLARDRQVHTVYTSNRHTVVREQFRDGERVAREVTRFRPGSVCTWSIAAPPTAVSLQVDQPLGPRAEPPDGRRVLQFTAALGIYGERP